MWYNKHWIKGDSSVRIPAHTISGASLPAGCWTAGSLSACCPARCWVISTKLFLIPVGLLLQKLRFRAGLWAEFHLQYLPSIHPSQQKEAWPSSMSNVSLLLSWANLMSVICVLSSRLLREMLNRTRPRVDLALHHLLTSSRQSTARLTVYLGALPPNWLCTGCHHIQIPISYLVSDLLPSRQMTSMSTVPVILSPEAVGLKSTLNLSCPF